MILRTVEWDGPDPAPGDVLRLSPALTLHLVETVAAGAGLGQWTIEIGPPLRIIEWDPRPARPDPTMVTGTLGGGPRLPKVRRWLP